MREVFESVVIGSVYVLMGSAIWCCAIVGSWRLLKRGLEYAGMWAHFYSWLWDTRIMPEVRRRRRQGE